MTHFESHFLAYCITALAVVAVVVVSRLIWRWRADRAMRRILAEIAELTRNERYTRAMASLEGEPVTVLADGAPADLHIDADGSQWRRATPMQVTAHFATPVPPVARASSTVSCGCRWRRAQIPPIRGDR